LRQDDNVAGVPLLPGRGTPQGQGPRGRAPETVGLTAETGPRYPHQSSGGRQLGPQALDAPPPASSAPSAA
jgi:osmoprotectant transport system ATP-binding protein